MKLVKSIHLLINIALLIMVVIIARTLYRVLLILNAVFG